MKFKVWRSFHKNKQIEERRLIFKDTDPVWSM